MSDKLPILVTALVDSFHQLLEADMTPDEKLTMLQSTCLSDVCLELAAHKGLGTLIDQPAADSEQVKGLLTAMINWMLSFEEVPNDKFEKYCELGELISAATENSDAWLIFKRLYVQFLIEQDRVSEAVPKIKELTELLPMDKEIRSLEKKYKGCSQSGSLTGCDNDFYALIRQLDSSSLEQLLSDAAAWVNKWVEEDHEYYGLLLKWYRSWYHVGLFGQDQGFINYFGSMYQYLKQNTKGIVSLYEQLADYRSKLTLQTILQHWMTFHPDLREVGRECLFSHYFDLDVIKCDKNEVFVDCGCYNGGTVKDFIHDYGSQYKSIYSYEPTPSVFELAKENLKDIPRLHLRNAGVSDKNGQLSFWTAAEGIDQAGNRLNPNGSTKVKVVRIDDDIRENVTFIKMDIEGAELDALRGAERQIRRNKPKLAISLYHKLPDLLEIPQLVKTYVPEYKLYLRHNIERKNYFPFPTEYVLLAKT